MSVTLKDTFTVVGKLGYFRKAIAKTNLYMRQMPKYIVAFFIFVACSSRPSEKDTINWLNDKISSYLYQYNIVSDFELKKTLVDSINIAQDTIHIVNMVEDFSQED